MKRTIKAVAVTAFVSAMAFTAVAFADDMVPGAYSNLDQSVMGVGRTMVQIGSNDRVLTDAVNRASNAISARNSSAGVNVDYQFGSSQYEQSWKAAKTVEQAQVRGLVAGDCQGDNSTETYRKQMGQSRNGFMAEHLISNKECGDDHDTKGGVPSAPAAAH